MENALKIYNETNRKLKALGYAGFLISWDMETEAPRAVNSHRKQCPIFSMDFQFRVILP